MLLRAGGGVGNIVQHLIGRPAEAADAEQILVEGGDGHRDVLQPFLAALGGDDDACSGVRIRHFGRDGGRFFGMGAGYICRCKQGQGTCAKGMAEPW
ncbi:hypothetical protein GCM10019071_25050 [Sphingobium fuliginis]|uniref:Uncharacterized protein n=1 Tax=Sphingobium fuliginis (strain ATCC 27551) TaxID=336203 RepID=A0ABQ1EYU0_SPHSA|nr:hypothetical protein GCM10019071_25050 [Sphingobium fuliginis]